MILIHYTSEDVNGGYLHFNCCFVELNATFIPFHCIQRLGRTSILKEYLSGFRWKNLFPKFTRVKGRKKMWYKVLTLCNYWYFIDVTIYSCHKDFYYFLCVVVIVKFLRSNYAPDENERLLFVPLLNWIPVCHVQVLDGGYCIFLGGKMTSGVIS
jgi:hypothetical protein